MTAATAVRTLAFGDLEAGPWGVAWVPVHGVSASLAVGIGASRDLIAAGLDPGEQGEEWRIEAAGSSLVLAPEGSPGRNEVDDIGIESVDQLCRVRGQVTVAGKAHQVDCLGWRAALRGRLDLDRVESFRQVSAWFAPSEGLALVALRPDKARGQDSDIVAAATLEPDPAPPVTDPRLSTTYAATGLPVRAGLELWLQEESPEQTPDDGAPQHFPRRAAGEAVGSALDWETAGFELHAELLRWHSRGREGAGVYLLGRRR